MNLKFASTQCHEISKQFNPLDEGIPERFFSGAREAANASNILRASIGQVQGNQPNHATDICRRMPAQRGFRDPEVRKRHVVEIRRHSMVRTNRVSRQNSGLEITTVLKRLMDPAMSRILTRSRFTSVWIEICRKFQKESRRRKTEKLDEKINET